MGPGFYPIDTKGGPVALSNDGSTVLCTAIDSSYKWITPGESVELGRGLARAISANGSVVAGEIDGRACVWDKHGSTSFLGAEGSQANAISDDGLTVAGAQNGQACIWQGGSMTTLGGLSGGECRSCAYGISGDGSVVVGEAHGNDSISDGVVFQTMRAFRWNRKNGMVPLGRSNVSLFPLLYFSSRALAASRDGKTIVGFVGMGFHERDEYRQHFIWRRGWLLDGVLEYPGLPKGMVHKPEECRCLSVSGDGARAVGFASTPHEPQTAFLSIRGQRTHDIRDYLLTLGFEAVRPWRLDCAIDISADGKRILGTGSDGSTGGTWIAELPA